MTALFFNFRLESKRIPHQNLLLGDSAGNLVALGVGVLAALAAALGAAEPIVLEALAVQLQAART